MMGTLGEFLNRCTATPTPVATWTADTSQSMPSRDASSTSSTLTDETVVEVTTVREDFGNKTAVFIDAEELPPTVGEQEILHLTVDPRSSQNMEDPEHKSEEVLNMPFFASVFPSQEKNYDLLTLFPSSGRLCTHRWTLSLGLHLTIARKLGEQ